MPAPDPSLSTHNHSYVKRDPAFPDPDPRPPSLSDLSQLWDVLDLEWPDITDPPPEPVAVATLQRTVHSPDAGDSQG